VQAVPTPGKRPFWLHQAAEYLIGAVFVAQGLQSPTPLVPSVLGGLVMLNAACAQGTLSAFRVFGKRMHRILDVVVFGLIAIGAVQPFVSLDNSTRLIMIVLLLVLGFIWVQSDFTDSRGEIKAKARKQARAAKASGAAATQPMPARVANPPDGTTADAIGRTAGRLAGKGVKAYRARKPR
jgi:hypothetical protein